jgi:hypothetical protein
MLPVEKEKGQIWLREQLLCEVEYEVSEPLKANVEPQVQRVNSDCARRALGHAARRVRPYSSYGGWAEFPSRAFFSISA